MTADQITGSGVVYFDGQFPAVPIGNQAGSTDYHGNAHGQVVPLPEAYTMAWQYLDTGIITNTCGESCTFEGVWD